MDKTFNMHAVNINGLHSKTVVFLAKCKMKKNKTNKKQCLLKMSENKQK